MNTNSKDEILLYEVKNPDISLEVKNVTDGQSRNRTRPRPNRDYKITFEAVPTKNKDTKVIYIAKFVSHRNHYIHETMNTIAFTQSPHLAKVFTTYTNSNNKITLELFNITMDTAIIQIIAQISDGPIHEYLSYNCKYQAPIDYYPYDESESVASSNNNIPVWVLIIIGVISIVIIIVLVIVLINCNKTKKDLLAKVQQTSFQQASEGNDGLLLNGDNNLT